MYLQDLCINMSDMSIVSNNMLPHAFVHLMERQFVAASIKKLFF